MSAISTHVGLLIALFAILLLYRRRKPKPPIAAFGSQRMCPACGLITSRLEACCLELWRISDSGQCDPDCRGMNRWLLTNRFAAKVRKQRQTMKNTKFIVKVDRGGTRVPEYVQRIDMSPIQMTPNRKLALMMGRFTAEDAVQFLQNSRCSPEVVSVRVAP